MKRLSPAQPSIWQQRIGGGVFLVTGLGLVVHLLVGLPLWLTVFGGIGLALGGLLSLAGTEFGAQLACRARIGLISGAAATLAYDTSRWLFAMFSHTSVRPFATWPLFGAGLIGSDTPTWAIWTAGGTYHVTNGLLFGVAFTVWLGGRGPLWGIAFAMALEAFMLGLYPGWLHLQAFGEFAQISVLGHLMYGTVLGFLARRLLSRRIPLWRPNEHADPPA